MSSRILLAFSVKKNLRRLVQLPKDPQSCITCMFGMRFLSMVWTLIGHSFIFVQVRVKPFQSKQLLFWRWKDSLDRTVILRRILKMSMISKTPWWTIFGINGSPTSRSASTRSLCWAVLCCRTHGSENGSKTLRVSTHFVLQISSVSFTLLVLPAKQKIQKKSQRGLLTPTGCGSTDTELYDCGPLTCTHWWQSPCEFL